MADTSAHEDFLPGKRWYFDQVLHVHDALTAELGRPLRVLQLGCASGTLAQALTGRSASVTVVDIAADAIEHARSSLTPAGGRQPEYITASAETYIFSRAVHAFDVVLCLDITRHFLQHHPPSRFRKLIQQISKIAHVLLIQLPYSHDSPTVADRILSGSTHSVSDDTGTGRTDVAQAREILDGYPYIHEIAHCARAGEIRPDRLCFASTKYWYTEECLTDFVEWTMQSQRFVGPSFFNSRRYYMNEHLIAQRFLRSGKAGTQNIREIERSISFLTTHARVLPHTPRVITAGSDEQAVWLVRERLPGRVLLDILLAAEAYNAQAVISDVLDELILLETHGLYHNDLRIWNVLLQPNGRTKLIDFGSIGPEREDCNWPRNLFFAFWIFVWSVASRTTHPNIPMPPPRLSPRHLPQPFAEWARAFWRYSPAEWSFALLGRLLQETPTTQSTTNEPPAAFEFLLDEMDTYLELLSARTLSADIPENKR